jgi:trk system potassium uptake protein
MRVIVMGCGRVGEAVSHLLAVEGHLVTVVDRDEAALARLGANFKGRKIVGVGFDRRVLLEAGIVDAEAFVATSSSDNANIVAARLARSVFRVPRVVARLYDPQQIEIYRRLGLVTFSTTNWGAERIHELITHGQLDADLSFGNGEVALMSIEVPPLLVGRSVKDITAAGEISVAAVTRQARAFIPMLGTTFQAGDIIHLVVLAEAMERLDSWLGLSEGGT